MATSTNSFGARADLSVDERTYEIFRLDRVPDIGRLPYSLKVLLENMLRHEDGISVTARRHRGAGQLGPQRRTRYRDRLRPGPHPDAGLHRRTGRG